MKELLFKKKGGKCVEMYTCNVANWTCNDTTTTTPPYPATNYPCQGKTENYPSQTQ
jgi:hypothetical protein